MGLLAEHNRYRKELGVPPLRWSNELAGVAQEWATQLAQRGVSQHHTNPRYGENLLVVGNAHATPRMVAETWAGERRNYDRATNQCRSGKCGHWTQMVWKSTQRLGCGVARNGNFEAWVCEYDPHGNTVGEKPF